MGVLSMQAWASLHISPPSAHQHFECTDQGRIKADKTDFHLYQGLLTPLW